MKYLYAIMLVLFVVMGYSTMAAGVGESNILRTADTGAKVYQAAANGSFKVSPDGSFVFTRPVVISCKSEKPFSITGNMASDVNNTISEYQIAAGKYQISGSMKVYCGFVSADSLPVAYAVLQPFIEVFFCDFFYVCFVFAVFGMLLYSMYKIL